ncbi:MAG: malonyl-CoA decarboxylase, partial [Acidimicrobiales bacterium]|nr:malonyl-CoA decarboxylase [Acidimicrobiales bacterium]
MQSRLERMWGQIRSWRGSDGQVNLQPHLPARDAAQLRRLVDDTIDGRGGEMAARRRATEIGACFLALDPDGRRRFFELLADEYGHDDREIDEAIERVRAAATPEERERAERDLENALRPKRDRLFRRFVGLEGGLSFLVDLREELLPIRNDSPQLRALDNDLRIVLARFFDLGLLRLERLTWDSPAGVLEKLIEYEAVHEIKGWDDLRGRLDTGRRCYAFFHPSMADDPVIFVEVAFTNGIPGELAPLLDHSLDRTDPFAADTATFYSISNCHPGLAGVPLGDLLIKSVVDELKREFPNLENLVTLSPIPQFKEWIQANASHIRALIPAQLPEEPSDVDDLRTELLRMAAEFIVHERRPSADPKFVDERAIDSVAHFHLSNGA